MTEKTKVNLVANNLSSFHIEADRCSEGMRFFISGIIGIGEYSDESLELLSHGGRVKIFGSRLKICIFENKTVEIRGKISEVVFTYGKS